eukprot:COSAG02_NODE_40102_length_409_cov_0.832258_1_plen_21_part_10
MLEGRELAELEGTVYTIDQAI